MTNRYPAPHYPALLRRFTYHQPTPEKVDAMAEIRSLSAIGSRLAEIT